MCRLLLLLSLALAAPAGAQPLIQGLDHLPVVVRDLAQAQADFQALGFVLKPGRPHVNGLRNAHAKFPDGTEIELITATAAVDPLSSAYVEALRQGDGPISFALYAPGAQPAPLEGIFFDQRQRSPTDRPEHFAHPNGASRLSAVWLAGSPAERQLVELTGGRLVDRAACAPFGIAARSLPFADGEIVLLPPAAQRVSGRPIVGASVVASLDAVRRFAPRAVDGCDGSLWVETHGLWLEFRPR